MHTSQSYLAVDVMDIEACTEMLARVVELDLEVLGATAETTVQIVLLCTPITISPELSQFFDVCGVRPVRPIVVGNTAIRPASPLKSRTKVLHLSRYSERHSTSRKMTDPEGEPPRVAPPPVDGDDDSSDEEEQQIDFVKW